MLITKAKKPYMIGKELVLPAAARITDIIYGKIYADGIRNSHCQMLRYVKELQKFSNNQCVQRIERIK